MLRRPNKSDLEKPPKHTTAKRTVHTLLSPEQLDHAMIRESTRVDRKSSGSLALVLFRLPDPKDMKYAVRLARTILKRIRVTDDVGWFDGEHLGLLLPDTLTIGAWRLAQEVCECIAQRGARPLCTMYTYPADGAEVETGVIRSIEDQTISVKVAS